MKSVYIHIPFCNTICSYCDFPKLYSSVCNKREYLRELKKEKSTFISRLTIPVNKVQKYANTIDKNKAIKRFCDELNKWLDFHMIGKITGIKTAKSENENLEIYLTIDC